MNFMHHLGMDIMYFTTIFLLYPHSQLPLPQTKPHYFYETSSTTITAKTYMIFDDLTTEILPVKMSYT